MKTTPDANRPHDLFTDAKGIKHRLYWHPLHVAVLRALGMLLLLTLLAGCSLFARNVKPTAVDESCGASCRLPCDATAPLWAPADPDAPNAWDSYPEQVTIPLRGKILACDLQRQECVKCLDRLKEAGVTK